MFGKIGCWKARTGLGISNSLSTEVRGRHAKAMEFTVHAGRTHGTGRGQASDGLAGRCRCLCALQRAKMATRPEILHRVVFRRQRAPCARADGGRALSRASSQCTLRVRPSTQTAPQQRLRSLIARTRLCNARRLPDICKDCACCHLCAPKPSDVYI